MYAPVPSAFLSFGVVLGCVCWLQDPYEGLAGCVCANAESWKSPDAVELVDRSLRGCFGTKVKEQKTRQDGIRQDVRKKDKQGKAKQGMARQSKSWQGNARHGKKARHTHGKVKARQHEARQDITRHTSQISICAQSVVASRGAWFWTEISTP